MATTVKKPAAKKAATKREVKTESTSKVKDLKQENELLKALLAQAAKSSVRLIGNLASAANEVDELKAVLKDFDKQLWLAKKHLGIDAKTRVTKKLLEGLEK